MSNRIAVVPGSFDPPTLGHLDVIRRAADLYDELHVLVVHNPGKAAMLPIAQRVTLLEQAVAEAGIGSRIVVASWSVGLLVDYAAEVGAGVLVKGIRSQVDVAYETPMAIVNRDLAGVETVFLLPDPSHALVSSSLVRQVSTLGGDVSPYVPDTVARYLDTGQAEARIDGSDYDGSVPTKRLNGPFVLPVRDIVRKPGEMREHTLSVPAPEQWGEGLVSIPSGEDVDVDVRLESVHEGILATADVATTYRGECGRCLREIAAPLKVEFQELFGYPGDEANDFEVQDDHVDLETLVRDSIVLSLPFQPVCEPDCPGLDPLTGERRTSGAPEAEEAIDPRWAALAALTQDHDGEAHGGDTGETEKS